MTGVTDGMKCRSREIVGPGQNCSQGPPGPPGPPGPGLTNPLVETFTLADINSAGSFNNDVRAMAVHMPFDLSPTVLGTIILRPASGSRSLSFAIYDAAFNLLADTQILTITTETDLITSPIVTGAGLTLTGKTKYYFAVKIQGGTGLKIGQGNGVSSILVSAQQSWTTADWPDPLVPSTLSTHYYVFGC